MLKVALTLLVFAVFVFSFSHYGHSNEYQPAALNKPLARQLVQQPEDPLGTVKGAENPALIPDQIAYSLLFRLLSDRRTDPDGKQARAYIRQALGCQECDQNGGKISQQTHNSVATEADIEAILAAADEFQRQVQSLDQQAKLTKDCHWPLPSKNVMGELSNMQRQKEQILASVTNDLPRRLSETGNSKLLKFINERFKRNMKLIPSPVSPPGGPGWRPQQTNHSH